MVLITGTGSWRRGVDILGVVCVEMYAGQKCVIGCCTIAPSNVFSRYSIYLRWILNFYISLSFVFLILCLSGNTSTDAGLHTHDLCNTVTPWENDDRDPRHLQVCPPRMSRLQQFQHLKTIHHSTTRTRQRWRHRGHLKA